MISTHEMKVGDDVYPLRLSTRAMRILEEDLGESLIKAVEQFQAAPNVTLVVKMVAQTMNDGAGADIRAAEDLIDQVGFMAMAKELEAVLDKAFPEAQDKGAGGATGKKKSPRR